LVPEVHAIGAKLRGMAEAHAEMPMLARTHGQSASPTTFGKEMANVGARVQRALQRLEAVQILAKWNGAVGNFNAHHSARPDLDWLALSQKFIESQHLSWNAYSTQIEPHDWIGEFCDACAAFNVILIDLSRDLWGYISLGYLRQAAVRGEVGSSTMPHKINPIDFENAEGNFGIANAMLRFFADKLPISRWQRDLSDSTVLRNLGVALGHSLIGWRSLQRGLDKLSPDRVRMAKDLEGAYEVIGEAIQSVLRAAGVPNGCRSDGRLHRYAAIEQCGASAPAGVAAGRLCRIGRAARATLCDRCALKAAAMTRFVSPLTQRVPQSVKRLALRGRLLSLTSSLSGFRNRGNGGSTQRKSSDRIGAAVELRTRRWSDAGGCAHRALTHTRNAACPEHPR
jgi:adenylosuccinate lyase